MPKIIGISKTSLWKSWKSIRKLLHKSTIRDITDFVEYDINPDIWIRNLLKDLNGGRYEPAVPFRFSLGKKMGFDRRMTMPSIPDLVVYRAVVERLYRKAKRREREHVYFSKEALSKARNSGSSEEDVEYYFSSPSSFAAWLEYNQYRKMLLLNKLYPYIVTTDITNFFDTVLFSRIADALHGISVDRNMIGLLFFLLERLSIRDPFNESPRIGLPVDEFDCSRTLAHMVLFPHDERMVSLVGEGAYVRWMDDQNFGVNSYAEGLEVLHDAGESLARLHLTANAGKSRILTRAEAARHFHFDINNDLDNAFKMPSVLSADRKKLRSEVRRLWVRYKKHEGKGEWEKIQKRFYRLAGIAQSRIFRGRALQDVLRSPGIIGRVADYMRVTGSVSEYIKFLEDLWDNAEQVYADVNHRAFEGVLRLEAEGKDRRKIRLLAGKILRSERVFPGWQRCAATAPLLILRFGDRRSLPMLKRLVSNLENAPHPAIGKAAVAVYVSYGTEQVRDTEVAVSRIRESYLSQFMRGIQDIGKYAQVPDRFKIRRETKFDDLQRRQFVDMRRLLVLRLLRLNRRQIVREWLREAVEATDGIDVSQFDKRLIRRLLLKS